MPIPSKLKEIMKDVENRFIAGESISSLQSYMKAQGIDEILLDQLTTSLRLSEDTVLEDSGESVDMTRKKRSKVTAALIITGIVLTLQKINADIKKFTLNPRTNSVIGGQPVSKKFAGVLAKSKGNKKATAKAVSLELGDILNKVVGRKVFNKAGFISQTYLRTEMASIRVNRKHKKAIKSGEYTHFRIPNTEHGHSDVCSEFQGKDYPINSSVQLPPYHPNCKHIVEYFTK